MTDSVDNTQKQAHATSIDALSLISDKWVVDVLHAILGQHNRYGMMLRHIDGISRKMLTQTLRRLERNGLIDRIDYDENPPRVEYFITPIGDAMIQQLTQLCKWSKQHFDGVTEAQERYDNSNDG